jgi:hypothetical protein
VLARSVVMATGRWRELDAEGIDRFRGAGVYHAAMPTDAERPGTRGWSGAAATPPAWRRGTSAGGRGVGASSAEARP